MSFKSLARKSHRGLWGLWFLTLLVTLIVPDTREALVCELRAFFHLSGGRTTVTPGGHTHLNPSYSGQLKAGAGKSVDDYLISNSLLHDGAFPSPQAWAHDPLLPWAAIKSAERITMAERMATTRPAAAPDPQTDERIHTTLELAELARQVEPENGLIWLAEAVARFARGEDPAALSALEVALSKKWSDHGSEPALRRQQLLAAAGIPAFDGLLPIHEACWTVQSVRSRARDHLLRMLDDAVRQRDDAAFKHRLGLFCALLDAGFERPFAPIVRVLCYEPKLIETMAVSQGITLPPNDYGTAAASRARHQADEDVCNAYLRQHAPALATTILREAAPRAAEHQRLSQAHHDLEMRHLNGVVRAEMFQKTAMLIVGGYLAALVAGVLAWRWPPEWPDGKKLRLHREFLFALIPALVLMFFSVWPVVKTFHQSESISMDGDGGPSHRPLLTLRQLDLLLSTALVALPLCLLLGNRAGQWLYRAGLVLGAYSYLAAIITAAIFRHDVVMAARAIVAG